MFNSTVLDVESGEICHSKMMNIAKDLHICGMCRKIFNDIQQFLDHKQKCYIVESHEPQSPSTNDTLSANGTIPSQTVMEFSLLQSEPFPLDLYYDNEEVVGDSITLQSQEEITPQDQLNEILSSSQIVNGVDQEGVAIELSEEVIDEDFTRNKLLDERTGVNVNTQVAGSVFLMDNKNCEKETFEEFIPKSKAAEKCNICNFATFFHRDLLRHMRKHTGDRPYKCCYCDKGFTRKDKLTDHKRIHLGDKRFKCQVCEYRTTDSGALKRHLRIHTDERPFKCQLCPYRARDPSHITVHLRTHTGDSPFFCQHEDCSRTFKTSSDLKRHMKDHKPDSLTSPVLPSGDTRVECSHGNVPRGKAGKVLNKSIPCYSCDNQIIKGVRRRRGRRGGHGRTACQRTHQCPHCSSAFVRPDSLRSHMKLHRVSTPLPDEPSELDEDITEKENSADTVTTERKLGVLASEEAAKEDPNPPLFFISSVDCPESLMPLVQDGTIHYIADTSFL
ncbi:nucleic acid-templated transcription, variant 2 [Homalodisca vitripennis]|nr:nucleic acid-templated transcription, variant 2 [Homalodisca vitripennis]